MKKSFLFCMLIFLISFSSAINFEYYIQDSNVLVKISYNSTENPNFKLPSDAKILDDIEGEKLNYLTSTLIEKSKNDYFLIIKNDLHNGAKISVFLPEGAFIPEKYFIFPEDYQLKTNGKNIIIQFENSTKKEIFIPYNLQRNFNYWTLFFLIIIGLLIFFFYYQFSNKKKYTQNLYHDEKEIMNYLLKRKVCWTKEIVKDLKISKVKLSRQLRKLEEKKLITKEPFGNENRIKLKK